MQIGLIGLGKMGLNLAQNMIDHNLEVLGYDASLEVTRSAREVGIVVSESMEDFLKAFRNRKTIWVMVPSGEITAHVLTLLSESCNPGDIIIDGGNTHYKQTILHAEMFKAKSIRFLDVGTSGGISGARFGACLMIGGDEEAYCELKSFFTTIATDMGLLYTGQSGSGHYLKMVHNGVEYGMMQAIGEGFELLKASKFDYDFADVANVWNHGSVVRSWLMELAYDAFREDCLLDQLTGEVDSNGEAQWTIESALELQVPTPVIALALMTRFRSKQEDTFTGKVVAALRKGFGGHAVKHRE